MNSHFSSPRQLSPYEVNHLQRWGIDPRTIAKWGETPVEYITGHVEFLGQDFLVTPAVLIPRVETEELVEHIILELETNPASLLQVADIGTGSGAIGLSIAKKMPDIQVWASDISPAALEITTKNVAHLHLNNVSLLESNLFEDYPQDFIFDVIVANLPYIPSARLPELDDSVTKHEPHLALDGGADGLDSIKQLLKFLPTRLKPTGSCWLEIDHTHQELLTAELPAHFQVRFFEDQFGQLRFAQIKTKSDTV